MCKLLGHLVKLIASMSTRRLHHSDDSSRRYRDVASASVPRPSRETVGPYATAGPEPSSSNRAATYSTSQVRNDNATNHSLSESQIPPDAHERASVGQDGPQTRKRSNTSLTKDEGVNETEGAKTRDKSRVPKDESQYRRDADRDTSRGVHHPSLNENVEIHRPPLVHSRPFIPQSANVQHSFEAQSRELCILQHEHRALLEEKRALTDAYAALRQQYDERSRKLNAVRQERQAALEQRREIDDAYATLKQHYDEQSKKLNTVRHERLAILEQKQKVDENYAALWQKYEDQRNEYNSLNNKYQSTKATLEQRTSELQGVQRFLTTADTFSGSEVVNTLRKVNEEVQQSTTFMGEWVAENFTFQTLPADSTTVQNAEQTRTLETLGKRFMHLLGTKKHNDNPILIEMAFRAYLMYELYWVASPWSVGEEEQSHNVYIDAIYQRIQEAEGQAVSGNWRALTRAYTLPACISDPEVAHTFDTAIVSGLSDILVAAGCTASKSDMTSALWSKFGEKVHHFVTLAGQVNRMIGVGVISEDFEVLVTWPETDFNERTMEDGYDNGDRSRAARDREEETVLCATELGLMQRIRVGAGAGQKGKPSELIVIKPKVALMSVVDIIE